MNEKNVFQAPVLAIILFDSEDVLTTSGGIELPDHDWVD